MTVYGFGEVLLRYTPPNYEQLKDANTFKVNVGGAELNALVTLAQFGHTTEMLTVLPNHALGHLKLKKNLFFQIRKLKILFQIKILNSEFFHIKINLKSYFSKYKF